MDALQLDDANFSPSFVLLSPNFLLLLNLAIGKVS